MSHLTGETKWYNNFSPEFKRVQWMKPFVHPSEGGCTAAGGMLATAGAIITLLPPPPARVLDAGCAEGHLSRCLSLCGYEVDAMDVCADVLNEAARRSMSTAWNGRFSTVHFYVQDYDHITNTSGTEAYDAIVFADALHHSRDRLATLRSAFAALKPGGTLIAAEPGLGHGRASVEWARKMDVTERSVLPWVLAREARGCGFRDVKFHPNPTTLFKAAYEPAGLAHHPLLRLTLRLFGVGLVSAARRVHGLTVMRKPKTNQQKDE